MPETWDDPSWPPGTVRIELLTQDEPTQIILQPRPTANPNDPLNWPQWRKYLNFGMAIFYALMVYAQINATGPTWGPMGDELNFSTETLNNTYAIGCATLALGAFMLVPFALKYGLRPIYILSSAAQLGVMVWAAHTRTAGDWWGINALQCWLGSLGECLVQMTVADVFFVHQRGLMNSIYVWVANVGGNLAVVASGFITESMGWRWVWWWCAILFGIQLVMFIFGFEESKFDWRGAVQGTPWGEDVVLSDKTIGDKVAVDPEKHASSEPSPVLSIVQIDPSIPRKTYWEMLLGTTTTKGPWQLFARHGYQPFLILFTIPGVAYMSLVYAVLLAWSTVFSAALSTYMIEAPYNFSSSQIGLMNLAPFIGNTLGSVICGPLSDQVILKLARRNNGIYEPEMRLWLFVPFIPFQVAGAFWFGYALQDGQSWVNVALAFGICNFGTAPISSIALTYMTDAYNEIIGDALVALTFSRNTLSTIFVFAMTPWIADVGMANVFNTIGAIGSAVLVFAFAFIWKGKEWRFKNAKRYKHYAARQFDPRPIQN
ncbi:major facilitator superfamily domain-containing protein [Pseudomassariella vexata]|uniref:Major facilitator superfamily domain-containing protein n=1 Tax=Pseudomassariella vexata TaxID=1141098 RepID=A0A1Y2DL82_9PEZI|nr:major facilitator superfamily domain-containing protein [Pseudomassariella vexata]ORY59981.1 major facilitator superfamily domain-containing protein [Pseudomassariella vexata]